MTEQGIAVLSDIHGNRRALEAVLADIARRGIRRMVNLGDSLYGPLDPDGTARVLMGLGLPTVRGNEDRILLEEPGLHPDSPSLPFVQSRLRPEQRRWLQGLPASLAIDGELLLCHGTPADDGAYLLREVRASGCGWLPAAAVAAALAATPQPIVLCGHDHLPAVVRLPGDRLVIDPGSVGLPAYRDAMPFPHSMEAGSPHARYGIVRRHATGIAVEIIAVPYDWDAAAAEAERNGRPDWGHALRTGFAAP